MIVVLLQRTMSVQSLSTYHNHGSIHLHNLPGSEISFVNFNYFELFYFSKKLTIIK